MTSEYGALWEGSEKSTSSVSCELLNYSGLRVEVDFFASYVILTD